MSDRFAAMLETLGHRVFESGGIQWYEYNGFLRPVGLPHTLPDISIEAARTALRRSGRTFVRWESRFGLAEETSWWFVVRRGPYSIDQLSGNTRSKIRRGKKRLSVRKLSIDELQAQGYRVCCLAVARYGKRRFLPDQKTFQRKLVAAQTYPKHLEFFGVFSDDKLVGFSENHCQGEGVFWESIWYDPAHLGDYSSYLLTHAMLDYYLKQPGVEYVSDGTRSLYHNTNVQQFFMEKFAFERWSARMHLVYRPWVGGLVTGIRPLRPLIEATRAHLPLDVLEKLNGLLLQDAIARDSLTSSRPSLRVDDI